MAQYQTNTDLAHKPGVVEKVKLKAEGLVDKLTGHSHTGTTTGVGGAGTGAGTNVAGGGANYAQTQPGFGEPTNPGYAGQQHTPTTGTTDAAYGQPQHQSVTDKIKGVLTPGHQSDTVGATHGTGTGHQTGTGTGYATTGVSTTDKIKNKLPGHHTTDAGTGYDNQSTY